MKRILIILTVFFLFASGCSSPNTQKPVPSKNHNAGPGQMPQGSPSLQTGSSSKNAADSIAAADKLLREGKYDKAVELYKSSLKANPDNEQAVFGETDALIRMERYEEALAVLEKYLDKHKIESKPNLLITRASIYNSVGKLDEAEADIKKAIELGIEKTPSKVLLAEIYYAQGHPEKSVEIADELLKNNPDLLKDNVNSRSKRDRAGFFSTFGIAYSIREQKKKAIECFDKSIELYDDPSVVNERGYTYFYMGEVEKARADMKRWMENNPPEKTADEIEAVGTAHMILGNYDEALKYVNRAMKKDPKRKGFLCARGEIYMWMGDRESAIKDFKLLEKVGNPGFRKEAAYFLKYMEKKNNTKQ